MMMKSKARTVCNEDIHLTAGSVLWFSASVFPSTVCVYPPQARQLSPAKSATDEGLVPSGESGEDLVALNLIEDDGQVLP